MSLGDWFQDQPLRYQNPWMLKSLYKMASRVGSYARVSNFNCSHLLVESANVEPSNTEGGLFSISTIHIGTTHIYNFKRLDNNKIEYYN